MDVYQSEFVEFEKNFKNFKKSKIVLYGIGRMTATLLPMLQEYRIMGLMDRDETNIGKCYYNQLVLSEEEVEKQADLVIINTAQTYWKTIYKRICNLEIPIYYLDGSIARIEPEQNQYETLDYWKTSYAELEEKIEAHDVISFDIFDTLLMRKIYLPLDIFRVIDRRVREKLGKDIEFYEVRKKASAYFTEKEATLAELYLKFAEIADIDLKTASLIQAIELEVEEAFIVPRTDIVDLLKMAVGRHKKIYLMSDMYLPKEFLQRIIEKYLGMRLSGCDIWISAELGVKKKDGTMWEMLVLHEAPMNILHIGDNLHSDIEMAQKYGIHTYYVMSGADMLSHSSIRGMAPYICTIEESLMMGLIMARWFNSPFALNVSKGRICVAEFDDMGYGLFGSLMLSFLRWLTQHSQVKAYDDFVFMSRDGYFLQQDYEFYKTISGQYRLPKSKYLKISRRLLAIANIKDSESFEYALRLPYNGSFGEYMEDRFSIAVGQDRNQDIHVSLPGDALKIVDWLKPYESQIKGEIQAEAKNYLKYLESMMVSKNFAVVDLCYYGTTQYLLAKFMKQQIDGYYFFANIMDTNQYYQNNMFPCFQTSDDPSAAQSETHKHVLLLESFLTAPYGMVMKVDENGQVIYNRDMENQIHFQEREQINIGIKQYLKDFVLLNGTQEVLGSSFITFSDRLYGMMMEDGIVWNTKIKTAFYNDNAMIHRRQLQILE